MREHRECCERKKVRFEVGRVNTFGKVFFFSQVSSVTG